MVIWCVGVIIEGIHIGVVRRQLCTVTHMTITTAAMTNNSTRVRHCQRRVDLQHITIIVAILNSRVDNVDITSG